MAKAQTKASNKYNDRMYDRIPLTVYRGEMESLKEVAAEKGMKLNEFIRYAIYKEAGYPEPTLEEVKQRPQVKYPKVAIPKDAFPSPCYWVDLDGNIYTHYSKETGNWFILYQGQMIIPDLSKGGYWVNSKGIPRGTL
jgi:hypothetical protein